MILKKFTVGSTMRLLHRYIGYFMAGIMLIYALSGILLVYRDTKLLKKEVILNEQLAPNLTEAALKEKKIVVTKNEGGVLHFKNGTYTIATGVLQKTERKLPWLLEKFTNIHQSKSKDKHSPLNVLFGICLLFFVVSSFFMFNTKSAIFKKALWFTLAGVVLSVLLVIFL